VIAGIRLTGLWIALLGAWGAIVPYVGPTFGYPEPAGSNQAAWQWTAASWQFHLVPGVVAVVAGLLLMSGASVGGLLGLLAGAWFIVGPEVRLAWASHVHAGALPTGASKWMQALTPIGYHLGTGLLMCALGAFALGLAAIARRPTPPPAKRRYMGPIVRRRESAPTSEPERVA
jgi:hypothetical protein